MQDGHTYIPLPGRTFYLEVGTCVLYIEVVVCACAYGYLTWRVVYTYICVYTIHIYTYIPSYRYNTCAYNLLVRKHIQLPR